MIVRTFVFSFFLPLFTLLEFAFQVSFFLLPCDREKSVFTNIELCKIWINRNADFRHCDKNYYFRYLRPLYTGCFVIPQSILQEVNLYTKITKKYLMNIHVSRMLHSSGYECLKKTFNVSISYLNIPCSMAQFRIHARISYSLENTKYSSNNLKSFLHLFSPSCTLFAYVEFTVDFK